LRECPQHAAQGLCAASVLVALAGTGATDELDAEMRELDPPDEDDPIGEIVYYLNLRLNLSTDHLSDRVLRLDPKNIESIQWSQKKGATDIYQ